MGPVTVLTCRERTPQCASPANLSWCHPPCNRWSHHPCSPDAKVLWVSRARRVMGYDLHASTSVKHAMPRMALLLIGYLPVQHLACHTSGAVHTHTPPCDKEWCLTSPEMYRCALAPENILKLMLQKFSVSSRFEQPLMWLTRFQFLRTCYS